MQAEGTKVERLAATRQDILDAVDIAMQQEFDPLERRVEQLHDMGQAWLDLPAHRRVKWSERTVTMLQELMQAQDALFRARAWNWTRRVAGYGTGNLFIGEA